MPAEPLVCPQCGLAHEPDERFCLDCGLPLIRAGSLGVDQEVSERHEWARKIKPQYAEGDLVRVVGAQHQAEAEFIQGLLLEEGVPSLIRRARGFDVPDMLSAGRRDLLVPRSGLGAARDVLMQAEILSADPARSAIDPPLRIAAGMLIAILLFVVIFGAVRWL